ncbi:hypothetical protein FPQ18DRAFT_387687 [Pyronema domesticum]|nr:hypothetical protein FPQ18DRAFT_387683 [Pyronema domesticum]KAI5794662.1 hypothetical protein FPQ18DRAFT_387687 [Pyronema domesticum]
MKFSASLLVSFGFIATALAKKGKHGGGSDDDSNAFASSSSSFAMPTGAPKMGAVLGAAVAAVAYL